MELIIVRHGRPERVEGVDGPADPGLTAEGQAQAEMVAGFLAAEPIDTIVSSPMRRARETAAPLARLLGHEPVILPGLAEIDHGSSEYLPMEEIKANEPELWREFLSDPMSMWGGDVVAFRRDVITTFDDLIEQNPGRCIVAFCHGMVTMTYLQHLVGHTDVFAFQTDYASLTRVRASSSEPVRTVRSVNETAHLGHTRIAL